MTAIIRKVKNKQGYFALCEYQGVNLVPVVLHTQFDFLVDFCKSEGYTWYFNLEDDKAVEVK